MRSLSPHSHRYKYSLIKRFGIPFLLVALACLANVTLRVWVSPNAFPLFTISVVLTAYLGGRNPAYFATLLSIIASHVLSLYFGNLSVTQDLVRLLMFGVTGYIIAQIYSSNVEIQAENERATESIKESEERYRTEFKSTPVPIFAWKFIAAGTGRGFEPPRPNAYGTAVHTYGHIDAVDSPETSGELRLRDISNQDDFQLIDFNDAALELTKEGISTLLGVRASVLYKATPEVIEYLLEAYRTRNLVHKEGPFQLITTNEQKYLDVTFVPVPPDLVLIHTEDITERKLIEQQVRESEERFALAQEAASIASWEWDVQTKDIKWSRNVDAIYGVPAEQLKFGGFIERVHPDDREPLTKALTSAALNQEGYSVEFRIIMPDKSIKWLTGKGKIFRNESGEPVKLVGSNVDITAFKEAEAEKLRVLADLHIAKEQAESANRAKDQFLAVLSHELRTPLSSILGYATMLSSGKLDNKQESKVAALKAIERNARIQVELIEDLLDVSRVISGKITLKKLIVGIPGLVQQVVTSFEPEALAKQINLSCVCDDKLWVSGDPQRLQQIFMNLINNALKFTPSGGTVEVRLCSNRFNVDVSIKDSGIGISEEFRPHLFQRFSQAEGGVRRRHSGLGLGLSIAKTLVDLHEGTITAQSDGTGKGSTFTVSLPLASPPLEEPTIRQVLIPEALQDALAGIKVLVVDDDADTLEMLCMAFEKYGAVVVATDSAQGARDALDAAKLPFNVIVSDVGMPVEDGLTFMAVLRAAGNSFSAIPSIALTAFTGDQYNIEALAAGFDEFLSKPIELDVLVATVKRVARLRKSLET